jgi:hypothetical protein
MENSSATSTSKTQRIIGNTMSGIVILFMLFDSTLKFLKPQAVLETTIDQLGYKEHHIFVHGLITLIPTILFAIPRTAILGAILLTAVFGGAIASHLRVDNPLFSHMLFPVYIGILMWGGLWLRDERIRWILPLR